MLRNEYNNIHYWLRTKYGKAGKCESLNCKGISNYFGYALLKGKLYEKKRENYIQLCKSCHSIYDFTEDGKKRISEKLRGKIVSQETKDRMRNSQIGLVKKKMWKKVYAYKDKKLFRIFDNATEASNYFGVAVSRVSICCKEKYWWSHTVKGYELKYEENN